MASATEDPAASATALSEVEALLARTAAPGHCIRRYETHGAVVIVVGETAYKLKKPVRLPYLDFSTPQQREAVCRREIEINHRFAPTLYRRVATFARSADGGLVLDGDGPAIEWAVVMRAFADDDLMAHALARTPPRERRAQLADALAAMVVETHARAEPVAGIDTVAAMTGVARQIAGDLRTSSAFTGKAAHFEEAVTARLAASAAILKARAKAGLVRRCHGDLHLGNIVWLDGRAVPFDAIEFDEAIATVDLLYDLAFLVMDLGRQGYADTANRVLAAYLEHTQSPLDEEGLCALPAFLALRAGVRAMVAFDRARQTSGPDQQVRVREAADALDLALGYLATDAPRLIAIGGFSGSGKSTLASALAPRIGAAPGAMHLRSDVIRKSLAGVPSTTRLGAEGYGAEMTARTYAVMRERAARMIAAGRSVIADAVHARPEERAAIEAVARRAGVAFHGLWLEAPAQDLIARVEARRGDASDATADVVTRQLGYERGEVTWTIIEAGDDAETVTARAVAALEHR